MYHISLDMYVNYCKYVRMYVCIYTVNSRMNADAFIYNHGFFPLVMQLGLLEKFADSQLQRLITFY